MNQPTLNSILLASTDPEQLHTWYAAALEPKGIQRGDGPAIAWFTDPAGNILSVLQEV